MLLALFFINCYSQNSYNFSVKAKNVRVWAKPAQDAVLPNVYLKFGETVRIIDAIIDDRTDGSTEKFCRIYRGEDNKTPYYLNLAEINLDQRRLQLEPCLDALTKEEALENISIGKKRTMYGKGEILFFGGPGSSYYKKNKGVYSFLNKASFRKSENAGSQFIGFYVVKNIWNFQVNGEDKYVLYCQSLATPFNEQKEKNIYIDFSEAIEDLTLQSLSYSGPFLRLMLRYANEYPSGETPNSFYQDYLTFLYGENVYNAMEEFKKHKLLNTSKMFVDSIFRQRDNVFKTELTDAYFGQLSKYDFNKESFELVSFTDGNSVLDQVISTSGLKFWPSGDLPFYGFINLPLFSVHFKMDVDSAEKFLAEIKLSSDNTNERQVTLIPHYKYISAEKAKAFCKKYDIECGRLDDAKIIEHMDVYAGKSDTKKWTTMLPQKIDNTINAKSNESSINTPPPETDTSLKGEINTGMEEEKVYSNVTNPANFPGGDAAFKRYIQREIAKNLDELSKAGESGTCKVKFIVDKGGKVSQVEALTMKGSAFAKVVINAINRGPKWTPAMKNGDYVNAFCEQEITFPMQ